jgi:hypothetical protein
MKKTQFLLAFLLAFLFISFITLMFIKQSARKEKLFKEFVYGKVVSSEKANKEVYHLTIMQNGKLRVLGYIPGNHELKAVTGDSIYKKRNSDVFYIRKNEMPNFIKTDWKDCHIGGKWED